jgi:hypothetical protein
VLSEVEARASDATPSLTSFDFAQDERELRQPLPTSRLDFHTPFATSPAVTPARRFQLAAGSLAALGLAAFGYAQIEGNDRGVPPIDSSANYEVGGVEVDVSARTADQARSFGWRLAQRRGWKMLWARANGRPADQAPGLSDGQLDQIVSGIAVEDEKIGARRYIARLGVLFDRTRAGELLGMRGGGPRSAPMLVIPVMWSGGAPVSFEHRSEWQKAWARFRSGGSPIDYVRPYGTGLDPLVLNVAQANRPGRGWWRMLLDQYGASDVVVPIVRLERRWPGGPVLAHFEAIHGPDGEVVSRFDLAAPDSDALPRMLDEGVRRIDLAYSAALRAGGLISDDSLIAEPALVTDLPEEAAIEEEAGAAAAPLAPINSFSLQVDTPDAAAQTQIETALRSVLGVRSVTTASLALGGVSIMRVSFEGDVAAFRTAAAARGLQADEAGGALRLRRAAP